MEKRGFGEQFNWIFIILSGAIILGFFTMFAFKYIQLEDNKRDVDSIKTLGSALNTLEKSSLGGAATSLDANTPGEGLRWGYKLKLNYQCLDNKASIFINNGEYANYELKDEIVFMEDQQNVNALDMWLVPWRFPFHVTNLIYLSDTLKNYYLIYDTNDGKDFLDKLELSSALRLEKVKIGDLKLKENARVVFFTSKEPSESKVNNLKGQVVQVSFAYVDMKKNEVSFYKEDGWADAVLFHAQELMYGAIFSDNLDSYQCNLNKALTKLKDTSNIYLERINVLNAVNRNPDCNYNLIADSIRNLIAGDYTMKDKIAEQNKGKSGCLWVY